MKKAVITNKVNSLVLTIPTYLQMIETIRAEKNVLKVLEKEVNALDIKKQYVTKAVFNLNKLIDYYGFLTVVMLDITIVIKNLLTANNKWEKNYYNRQAFLLIYEAIRTYYNYSKPLDDILKLDYPELILMHKKNARELRKFKKYCYYDSTMAAVRGNTIAHINKNFSIYCKIISEIESKKILNSALRFIEILKHMENIMSQIIIIVIEQSLKSTGKPLNYYLNMNKNLTKDLKRKLPKLFR